LKIEDKTKYIDKVLGFYFEKPFAEIAPGLTPSGGEADSWYRTASVFQAVFETTDVDEVQKELLFLLVEDAVTEFKASASLGEQPDTDEELGIGYEEYGFPEGFKEMVHVRIWEVIFNVYSDYEPSIEIR